MKLLARVVSQLESWKVAHALVGAGAMAAHGVSRATLDLDLLTTDRSLLDPRRWGEIRDSNVDVEVRRGDSEDPLAGVVRLRAPGERPVDLVVGRHAWQQRVIERAERLLGGEILVPVIRAADLILLKLFAGGVQDAWDIEQLLAAGDREAPFGGGRAKARRASSRMRSSWTMIRSR